MIEAKELRIGNWVYIKCVSKSPLIVDDWSEQEFNAFNMKSILFNSPDFIFKPIPITEDWLDRFGIHHEGVCFWDVLNSYSIRLNKNTRCVNNNMNHTSVHIEYIHQLQNLYFALTGKELILNN